MNVYNIKNSLRITIGNNKENKKLLRVLSEYYLMFIKLL